MMTNFLFKVLVIIIILSGETLAILAEMIAARAYVNQPFVHVFLKVFLIMLLGGIFLVSGYTFGLKVFQNIWVVSVVSITSILIMEPIIIYSVFHQLPSRGTLIGFVFGVLGFISALFL